jgi:hypothetical protein
VSPPVPERSFNSKPPAITTTAWPVMAAASTRLRNGLVHSHRKTLIMGLRHEICVPGSCRVLIPGFGGVEKSRHDVLTDNEPPVAENVFVSTGVPGLDHILGGGFIRDGFYLLQGDPGSGKTTVALQYLFECAKAGERGLYITLTETCNDLERACLSHGWSINVLPAAALSVRAGRGSQTCPACRIPDSPRQAR